MFAPARANKIATSPDQGGRCRYDKISCLQSVDEGKDDGWRKRLAYQSLLRSLRMHR